MLMARLNKWICCLLSDNLLSLMNVCHGHQLLFNFYQHNAFISNFYFRCHRTRWFYYKPCSSCNKITGERVLRQGVLMWELRIQRGSTSEPFIFRILMLRNINFLFHLCFAFNLSCELRERSHMRNRSIMFCSYMNASMETSNGVSISFERYWSKVPWNELALVSLFSISYFPQLTAKL